MSSSSSPTSNTVPLKACVIAIVGTGMIGRSWAATFARAGHPVRLFNRNPAKAHASLDAILATLRVLSDADLLHQQTPESVLKRIEVCDDLHDAVGQAGFVQENIAEEPEAKRDLFRQLNDIAPEDAILASSTSHIVPSVFLEESSGANRSLVAHPLNPPHLCPLVELLPSPWTSLESVQRCRKRMLDIGQRPIVLQKETEGFVVNRLQGALLDEAFNLVAEGIASVADIDDAIKHGLALRWSFMGPFETIDLNAPEGVRDYLDRYAESYVSLGQSRPARHPWTGQLAAQVIEERTRALDRADLDARRAWRDRQLAALVAHKRRVESETP
ncbi:MAG: 3-hydroxyacyl-CoA dehydrogenase [Planctomycetota bacterium]